MLSLTVAATCLLSTVIAQLPPSYTQARTNTTLGVKYGSVNVKSGSNLPYNAPSLPPTLSSSHPLNGIYIALLVDTTANLSAPIPASLLWFQQDLTFSTLTSTFSTNTTPQVPYLAPSTVGHAYLVLLYQSPPGFHVPADFPYNATFRRGFNVSRVAVDFGTPLVQANWFLLGSNCTEGKLTALAGVFPSGTGVSVAYPTGTAGYQGRKGSYPRSGFRLRA